MCVCFNLNVRANLRSIITNICNEFSLFHTARINTARTAHQSIIRSRRRALGQTAALVATCSILTSGLGLSPAQADMTMNPNAAQTTISKNNDASNGFWGLKYYFDKNPVSAEGGVLDLVTGLFRLKGSRATEVSKGQQHLTGYDLNLTRGNDAVLRNDSFGWRSAPVELDPVKIMWLELDDGKVFTIAGTPVEKDAILVELALGRKFDCAFFNVGYYGELGDLAQNQGLKIDASFNF